MDDQIKKALYISESYLWRGESSNISFDKIFKKIFEISLEFEDLLPANTYNDTMGENFSNFYVKNGQKFKKAGQSQKIPKEYLIIEE